MNLKKSDLQFTPLREKNDVVDRLSAHVKQRLAALADSDRVRTFRIPTRQSFPETDVQKPELNPLTGLGSQGPPALFTSGVIFRIHR